jgi:hypothetical protein
MCCLLGLLALGSCGTSRRDSCQITAVDLSKYENLAEVEQAEVGRQYAFTGVFFTEYHADGLIGRPFVDAELFQLQKYDAFCVQLPAGCEHRLRPSQTVKRLATGEAVADVTALVRFVSRERHDVDPGGNNCHAGTLQVEKVVSVRWR